MAKKPKPKPRISRRKKPQESEYARFHREKGNPLPDILAVTRSTENEAAVAMERGLSNPQILVITPVHASGSQFLDDAYRSLSAQTYAGWRWHIVLNNGGTVAKAIEADPRVIVTTASPGYRTIGALKGLACHALTTELQEIPYILELDCDDILHGEALEHVLDAFNEGADFVYSDFAEFYYDAHGKLASARPDKYPFGAAFGWRSYTPWNTQHAPFVDLSNLIAMVTPPVTPQNLRLIEWAPNHLRAWTRAFYERVGGHDVEMGGADDHDLMVRMYLEGARFHHIPLCLYYQRIHTYNSQTVFNGEVRAGTWNVYNRSIWDLARKFSRDNNLAMVDLCSGPNPPPSFEGWDRVFGHELEGRWPAADNTVGLIRAQDAVEHLRDPIHTMNEAHRVLAPGGFFIISTPSTDGRGAFCDPTHVSFWNLLSFRYYCEAATRAYIPAFRGKFVCTKLVQWFPNAWCQENNVPYVEAHLMKDYEGRYGADMQGNG